MTVDAISVQRRDAVVAIGFDRPGKKNALTAQMYVALERSVREAEDDAAVRVILFHGSEQAFTAGNDLNDFIERPPEGEAAPVFRFVRTVAKAAKPMVAAVNGPAVGLGTTLLLHCDLVYAGDNARFQLPFVRLGLVPEFGSSYLLPLVAGYQRAAEMLLLGEPFDAQAARDAGFVTRVMPASATLDAAWDAARQLATLPPGALRATKALLKRAHRGALDAQIGAEGTEFARLLREPAAREAFAAFLAKRKPDFTGMV